MYTPEDIRNVTFQRSVSGYKPGDVEAFLEEIAQQMEAMAANKQAAAPQPAPQPTPAKQTAISGISEEGLQNLLISAQRTADSIIAEAREKAAQIVAEAEQKAQTNNLKLRAQLEQTQEKIKAVIEESDKKSNDLIKTATSKSDSMISAAHDSVARQQLLFDKLKVSVSDFKKDLVSLYKKQLELISDIPDEVPASPDDIARAVEFVIDSHPSPESFINEAEEKATIPADSSDHVLAESVVEASPEHTAEEPVVEPSAEADIPPAEPADEVPDNFNLFEASAEDTETEQAQPSPIMAASPESRERRRSSLKFFEEYDDDDDDEDYDDEPKSLFKRRKK